MNLVVHLPHAASWSAFLTVYGLDVRAYKIGRLSAPRTRSIRCVTSAWGRNPERDALYLNVVPAKNDGTTAYKLDVNSVLVDGSWSISVYSADGSFQTRPCDLSVPPRLGTVPLAVWQPRPPTGTGSAAADVGPEER